MPKKVPNSADTVKKTADLSVTIARWKSMRGRKPQPIEGSMVTALAKRGLTQEDCAAVLEVSADTIYRRFSKELALGRQQCCSSLRRKQFDLAMAGNVTMLVWLGKNLLGQSDKHELTGKDGAPLIPDVDREEIIGKLIGSGAAAPAARVQ